MTLRNARCMSLLYTCAHRYMLPKDKALLFNFKVGPGISTNTRVLFAGEAPVVLDAQTPELCRVTHGESSWYLITSSLPFRKSKGDGPFGTTFTER